MRYLLYLPGIILLLLPFLCMRYEEYSANEIKRQKEADRAAAAEQRRIEAERKQAIQAEKAAEREAAKGAKEAEKQRKQEARLEAARQRAEYAERELAAKRAAKALDRERAESIPAKPEQPAEQEQPAAPVEPAEPMESDEPVESDEPEQPAEPEQRTIHALLSGIKGNNAFKGQVVAFTGRLPGMPRREAIQAVQDNGGRAYTKMPVGTTILVVGEKPGMCKMDKADEWIGQVRKITAAQFFAMLEEPLTIEADEFAAMLGA